MLGGATWFAASMFREGRQQWWLATLMVVNGIGSLATAMAAAVDMSWILSSFGFVAYVGWNILMAAISILIFLVLTPRRASP